MDHYKVTLLNLFFFFLSFPFILCNKRNKTPFILLSFFFFPGNIFRLIQHQRKTLWNSLNNWHLQQRPEGPGTYGCLIQAPEHKKIYARFSDQYCACKICDIQLVWGNYWLIFTLASNIVSVCFDKSEWIIDELITAIIQWYSRTLRGPKAVRFLVLASVVLPLFNLTPTLPCPIKSVQQKWFGSVTSSPPPHPREGYRKVGMLWGSVKRLFVIRLSRRGSKFLNKIFLGL